LKINFKSKPFIKTVLLILCCTFVISFFLLSKHFLPRAVCYNVTSTGNDKVFETHGDTESIKENISEIFSDGPFIITIMDNGIYVMLDGKPVYKVKLNVSELTEKDKRNLYEGIEITGKQNLSEIIALMES